MTSRHLQDRDRKGAPRLGDELRRSPRSGGATVHEDEVCRFGYVRTQVRDRIDDVYVTTCPSQGRSERVQPGAPGGQDRDRGFSEGHGSGWQEVRGASSALATVENTSRVRRPFAPFRSRAELRVPLLPGGERGGGCRLSPRRRGRFASARSARVRPRPGPLSGTRGFRPPGGRGRTGRRRGRRRRSRPTPWGSGPAS
jgi:hypothetical protein